MTRHVWIINNFENRSGKLRSTDEKKLCPTIFRTRWFVFFFYKSSDVNGGKQFLKNVRIFSNLLYISANLAYLDTVKQFLNIFLTRIFIGEKCFARSDIRTWACPPVFEIVGHPNESSCGIFEFCFCGFWLVGKIVRTNVKTDYSFSLRTYTNIVAWVLRVFLWYVAFDTYV